MVSALCSRASERGSTFARRVKVLPRSEALEQSAETIREELLHYGKVLAESRCRSFHRFGLNRQRWMGSPVKLPLQLLLRVRHSSTFILQTSRPSCFGDMRVHAAKQPRFNGRNSQSQRN